jgi:hypothetical protein
MAVGQVAVGLMAVGQVTRIPLRPTGLPFIVAAEAYVESNIESQY